MIDKERITIWCEALESGIYQQAIGKLKDGNGYCCLGVACEISNLGEWTYSGEYSTDDGITRFTLPLIVQNWYGLEHENPLVNLTSEEYATFLVNYAKNHSTALTQNKSINLTDLNDNGFTFTNIAAIIRRNFLGD